VLVFAFGSTTSGIPRASGTTSDRPGVKVPEDLSAETARHVAAPLHRIKRLCDVAIASLSGAAVGTS
jgi:poly-gamma-glutamate capsule biosynthesis protein CapA/YwtB (metallophosphatase superfamily)